MSLSEKRQQQVHWTVVRHAVALPPLEQFSADIDPALRAGAVSRPWLQRPLRRASTHREVPPKAGTAELTCGRALRRRELLSAVDAEVVPLATALRVLVRAAVSRRNLGVDDLAAKRAEADRRVRPPVVEVLAWVRFHGLGHRTYIVDVGVATDHRLSRTYVSAVPVPVCARPVNWLSRGCHDQA